VIDRDRLWRSRRPGIKRSCGILKTREHVVMKNPCGIQEGLCAMERRVEFRRESEFWKIDRDNEKDELDTCKRGFPMWLGVLICVRFVGFAQCWRNGNQGTHLSGKRIIIK